MASIGSWHGGSVPTRIGGSWYTGQYANIWPHEWINCDHNGDGPAALQFSYPDQPTVNQAAYVRMPPVWPTSSLKFLQVRPAGPQYEPPQVSLAIAGRSNGGQLALMLGSGESQVVLARSEVRTVALLRYYRFEMLVDHANRSARALVSHLHTNAPLWDSDWVYTGIPVGTVSGMTEIGAAQGSLLLGHIRIAHVDITDSTALIGRHASDAYPWDPPLGDYTQIRLLEGGSLVNPTRVALWESGKLINAVSATYSAEVLEPEPPEEEVGTALATLSFDSQTNGQPLSLSSPWDEFGDSAGTHFLGSTAAAKHGALGTRNTNSVGYRAISYDEAVDVADVDVIRDYDFYFNVRSRSDQVWLLSTAGTAFGVGFNADGTVRIRNQWTTVATSTETLSLGTWYRLSHRVAYTGQTLRIYEGESAVPLFELSGPLSVTTWPSTHFGLFSSSDGTTIDIDTIRIGDGWLPPVAP